MKALRALLSLVCLLQLTLVAFAQGPGATDAGIPNILSDAAKQNLLTFVQPDYPP
jgi:hypothetical protein